MPVKYHEGNFPPKNIDWERIVPAIASASDAIGRYDSFLRIIPNPDLLVSPLLIQEAVASSRIEGIRTNAEEVLIYEAGKKDINPARTDDIHEVINYQLAIKEALSELRTLPLSGRVIKAAHAVLLQGVRGQFKSPGRYRIDQNWIGRSYNIEEARYIPPVPDFVPEAMSRWEQWVNDESIQPLIKVAVAHAEFEAIHPFDDGNGRCGRMTIPLMLYIDGQMCRPCFYMSEFFEHRNDEYQDQLLAVSKSNDWTSWIDFFLGAVADQARENHAKARAIFELHERIRKELASIVNSRFSDQVIDLLFSAFILSADQFSKIDGVKGPTGRRLLGALKELGIVKEIIPASGPRPSILFFKDLFDITERRHIGNELAHGN